MQEVRNMFGSSLIPEGCPAGSVAVRLTTLDAYCSGNSLDRIEVIKIDVEGHEPEVLQGATRMLDERRIGVIIIEEDSHRASLYQGIMARGYHCGYYNPRSGLLEEMKVVDEHAILSRKPSTFSSNLVFVEERQMERVAALLRAGWSDASKPQRAPHVV